MRKGAKGVAQKEVYMTLSPALGGVLRQARPLSPNSSTRAHLVGKRGDNAEQGPGTFPCLVNWCSNSHSNLRSPASDQCQSRRSFISLSCLNVSPIFRLGLVFFLSATAYSSQNQYAIASNVPLIKSPALRFPRPVRFLR